MKRDRQLSEYAVYRLQKRLQAREEQARIDKENRKRKIKAILWLVGDVFAVLVLMVAITTLSMLDSPSYTPTIIFGISVFILTIYGAARGVLGS